MPFQIEAMDPAPFAPLFALSDQELALQNAVRRIVDESPGAPCRVSLEDARVGETVLLVNHEHQSAASPYRARHAVYVREHATRASLRVGEVPPVLSSRLLSVRCFDSEHMMNDADVVDGTALADTLERKFHDRSVAYVHIHYAKPGCFAASATRAENAQG